MESAKARVPANLGERMAESALAAKDGALNAASNVSMSNMSASLDGIKASFGTQYKMQTLNSGAKLVIEIPNVTGDCSVSRARDAADQTIIYAFKRVVVGNLKGGLVDLAELKRAEDLIRMVEQPPKHENLVACCGTAVENVGHTHAKLLLLELCEGGTLSGYTERSRWVR